ncbi:MAG: substrate-binding domain-containing protein [Sedimentitalea sp.]
MPFFKTAPFQSLTVALCLAGMTEVQAESVTLSEMGSEMSIQGELLSFDGDVYVVRTLLGDLQLSANRSICEGPGCPATSEVATNLYLAGSGTVTANLIPGLAQAYFGAFMDDVQRDDSMYGRTYFEIARPTQPDLMVTLVHTNSAAGIDQLLGGELHGTFTTRPVDGIEQSNAAKAGFAPLRSEEQESIIAYDSLLVVTHPSNQIQAMTETDIASIFAGDIANWQTFGRAPGQINVYLREDGSNSRELLQNALLAPHRKDPGDQVIILGSDIEIAQAVRNDPNGIGLTSFVHRDGVRALEIEGVCGIRVPATEFSIKTGEYPLARPIYFYHTAQKAPVVEMGGFADFIASNDAQTHVRNAGFIDREIVAEPLNTQGLRVTHTLMGNESIEGLETTRRMLELMSYADRLSTTIRFDGGAMDLDSEDYQQLEMLADLIRSDDYDGAKFYFMGFSDSVGRADLNQFIALQRAEIVRQALISRYPELSGRIEAKSVGYGELSPLACNETRPGRIKNRRVEIWAQRPLAVASR